MDIYLDIFCVNLMSTVKFQIRIYSGICASLSTQERILFSAIFSSLLYSLKVFPSLVLTEKENRLWGSPYGILKKEQ